MIMGFSFSSKGDWKRTMKFLMDCQKINYDVLRKYGERGVEALANNTPIDSGETASSWYYKVEKNKAGATISFHNSHIIGSVNIAIILQYGHGTKNGGWVEGRDYINPAIQPVFDTIADELWREVIK